ncbi:hypothetical protein ACVI1J_001749 [Bradyrhizobium diazoefficiens]
MPSPELVEEKRKELTPIALGSLSLGPDGVLGNISIPWDALTPILQMLIAGRFKFVLMRGTRFRHRSAKLNSLRLETKLTEDDPLPEEGVVGDPAAGLQASPGPGRSMPAVLCEVQARDARPQQGGRSDRPSHRIVWRGRAGAAW